MHDAECETFQAASMSARWTRDPQCTSVTPNMSELTGVFNE